MGWFKDNIWHRFFPEHYKQNDTYINPLLDNKGLSQRFMETFGEYLDEKILPDIDQFIDNVFSPKLMVSYLLPYREGEKGVDLVYDNTLAKRRQILQYFIRISQVKGTRRGYEVCFKLMTFNNLIIYTVDVIVYFDNPLPTAGCNACYEYDVILTGTLLLLLPDIVDAFFNIIDYNEPVDCNIRFVIYNDNYVVRDFVTFFFKDPQPYSYLTGGQDPNLYIDNSRNPTFSGSYVDSEGNLYLDGSDEQYYEFDEKYFANIGQMIFRKPAPDAYTYFDALPPTNVTATSFTANWEAKSGATKYFLNVGLSRANDNDIIKERVIDNLELSNATTSKSAIDLEENTTYYYQVIAVNAQGQRALSSVGTVITKRTVATPTALNPIQLSSYYFMAAWQKVAGATAYELDVSNSSDFSTNLQTFQLRNINQYIVYRGVGVWYYRVRAKIDRYSGVFYKTPISISANSNVIEVEITDTSNLDFTSDFTSDFA